MAFQSLYRRYRPRRFTDVRGQEHVIRALHNAVREGTVAHAYLFSGPRGTGKTSTARILAKALNCEQPVDGEPCCQCEPCLAVEAGTSLVVNEMDAASNRGVDDMRDLIARVALGTAGKVKLYILDEVHMLTKDASNTLLKTLEEPPAHVVFVLATTEPEKVLDTIRSRTQHFDFHLLNAQVLTEHLRWVVSDAGIDLDEQAIDAAVRRGRGSARDALSALDQIIAAGGEVSGEAPIGEIVEGMCESDVGRALAGVASATAAGHDARRLAEALLAEVRDAFLSTIAPEVLSLPEADAAVAGERGRRLGPAAAVRALDLLGEAVLAMREAPDPRVVLEAAVVRVARADLDASPAALLERVQRLERSMQAGNGASSSGEGAPNPAPSPATPAADSTGAPAALGAHRRRQESNAPKRAPAAPEPAAPAAREQEPPVPKEVPKPAPQAPAPPQAGSVTRDDLTAAWGDVILAGLRGRMKGLFSSGRFVAVEDGVATFAVPGEGLRSKADSARGELEAVLSGHFGTPLRVKLVVEGAGDDRPGASSGAVSPGATGPGPDDDAVDLNDLVDAPAAPDGVQRLTEAFPGAEVVERGDQA